eukprot:PITA_32674
MNKDSKEYCSACDLCQKTEIPLRRDELPLSPQVTLQDFDKWAIEFVVSIIPLGKKTGARYIITTTNYLTRWAEAQPVKDCSGDTAAQFIFEYILSIFQVIIRRARLIILRTTCKKLTGQTPFRLDYGQEAVIPMEYIVPSLIIIVVMDMVDNNIMEERLDQQLALEEDRFITGFHQQV